MDTPRTMASICEFNNAKSVKMENPRKLKHIIMAYTEAVHYAYFCQYGAM